MGVLYNRKDNFKDKNMTAVAERIFKDALDLLPIERANLQVFSTDPAQYLGRPFEPAAATDHAFDDPHI